MATIISIHSLRGGTGKSNTTEVAAVLPHAAEMMNLASAGIFVLRYPDHPLTRLYKQIVVTLAP